MQMLHAIKLAAKPWWGQVSCINHQGRRILHPHWSAYTSAEQLKMLAGSVTEHRCMGDAWSQQSQRRQQTSQEGYQH